MGIQYSLPFAIIFILYIIIPWAYTNIVIFFYKIRKSFRVLLIYDYPRIEL